MIKLGDTVYLRRDTSRVHGRVIGIVKRSFTWVAFRDGTVHDFYVAPGDVFVLKAVGGIAVCHKGWLISEGDLISVAAQ